MLQSLQHRQAWAVHWVMTILNVTIAPTQTGMGCTLGNDNIECYNRSSRQAWAVHWVMTILNVTIAPAQTGMGCTLGNDNIECYNRSSTDKHGLYIG